MVTLELRASANTTARATLIPGPTQSRIAHAQSTLFYKPEGQPERCRVGGRKRTWLLASSMRSAVTSFSWPLSALINWISSGSWKRGGLRPPRPLAPPACRTGLRALQKGAQQQRDIFQLYFMSGRRAMCDAWRSTQESAFKGLLSCEAAMTNPRGVQGSP